MTNILIKILIVTIILLTSIIVYTLLKERSELHREGVENMDNIINTSDTILKQPMKNLCIMASSNSLFSSGVENIENIENVIRSGARWLDFNVIEKETGIPYVSETIKLETALEMCRNKRNLSGNANMPFFINIRIGSKMSLGIYDNIHKSINNTFSSASLYSEPGKIQTLLGDVKTAVMNKMNKFKNSVITDTSKTKKEGLEPMTKVLGTENELYENLTSLTSAYHSNSNSHIIEGMKNDDIYSKIEKVQEKVLNLKKRIKKFDEKAKELMKKFNGNAKIKMQIDISRKKIEDQLANAEKKLKTLEDESERQQNKDTSKQAKQATKAGKAINSSAKDETEDLNIRRFEATEPFPGASPNAQREIDKLRQSELDKQLENANLQKELGDLNASNANYEASISKIKKNMDTAYAMIEQDLTKKVQCERCVTGDTVLGELSNKVIIVLTRSAFITDSYRESKLNSVVNIEINDYNNVSNDKFYNVPYSKNNYDATLSDSIMKTTIVPSDATNIKKMMINNIHKRNVQIVQVPDLETKPEYINLFKNFKSAFIPLVDARNYINQTMMR